MNSTIKIVLAILAGIALSLILVGGGFLLGRFTGPFNPYPMMMGFQRGTYPAGDQCPHLGGFGKESSSDWGMMGRYSGGSSQGADPLSMEETEQIVQDWLADSEYEDLAMGEVMIFDNHSYVEIMERSTGIGAMEVLVDPGTRAVYPEHGPNMMWNLKYSSMAAMHGGNWSRAGSLSPEEVLSMPVTPEKAVTAAQDFLDRYHPGMQADEDVDIFYGYYTLHVLEEGEVIGMLSVHGESGQVYYHDWHGTLLEMSEH